MAAIVLMKLTMLLANVLKALQANYVKLVSMTINQMYFSTRKQDILDKDPPVLTRNHCIKYARTHEATSRPAHGFTHQEQVVGGISHQVHQQTSQDRSQQNICMVWRMISQAWHISCKECWVWLLPPVRTMGNSLDGRNTATQAHKPINGYKLKEETATLETQGARVKHEELSVLSTINRWNRSLWDYKNQCE